MRLGIRVEQPVLGLGLLGFSEPVGLRLLLQRRVGAPLAPALDGQQGEQGIQRGGQVQVFIDKQANVDHIHGDPQWPALHAFLRHPHLRHQAEAGEVDDGVEPLGVDANGLFGVAAGLGRAGRLGAGLGRGLGGRAVCRVPVGNLIGPENAGFMFIMANFQAERLSLAVMAYMTAQMALEACLDYVKDRVTFGKPLAKHQVIRHKLAEMATRVEVAREYSYRVAARMQAGQPAINEVCMAKNFATDVADYVTHEAVQIFGGMGYMRESVVERLYRDNRILSIGGGTHEIMNEIIAKQMGL